MLPLHPWLRHCLSLRLPRSLTAVGVSAVTGEGCADLFAAIDKAGEEYKRDYEPGAPTRTTPAPHARDPALCLPAAMPASGSSPTAGTAAFVRAAGRIASS